VNNRFSGRRVLLVEDEPIVAWLLKDMLVDFGCSVVGPAADVNQALAMIDAESIDVAVLDVNLRGQMSYPIALKPDSNERLAAQIVRRVATRDRSERRRG
jgi:CheY-like chemotaxis protein